jgi:hypothetical protein
MITRVPDDERVIHDKFRLAVGSCFVMQNKILLEGISVENAMKFILGYFRKFFKYPSPQDREDRENRDG